jgi:hypothetical protein
MQNTLLLHEICQEKKKRLKNGAHQGLPYWEKPVTYRNLRHSFDCVWLWIGGSILLNQIMFFDIIPERIRFLE